MNHRAWDEIERLLDEFRIRPILAVIPDNRDPGLLQIDEADSSFWDRVSSWQERGWTIGLHGHQHLYVTQEKGIVGHHRRSEFAGLPAEVQERKIRLGLSIFREKSIEPTVWVAPSHSFDTVTVSVLKTFGISIISDGLGILPYRDDQGVLWMPQQLGRFRSMPYGVWTVCIHHNRWGRDQVWSFRKVLAAFKDQITDVPTIEGEYDSRSKTSVDALAERLLGIAWRAKQFGRAHRLKEPV